MRAYGSPSGNSSAITFTITGILRSIFTTLDSPFVFTRQLAEWRILAQIRTWGIALHGSSTAKMGRTHYLRGCLMPTSQKRSESDKHESLRQMIGWTLFLPRKSDCEELVRA